MINILHIESSARTTGSISRRVAEKLVEHLRAQAAEASVTLRDLAAAPLPHVDAAFVAAMFVADEAQTQADRDALRLSEELIAEIEAADAIVLGVPMYSYGVPSALKAWIDHVVRARRTFRHAPSGPVGLLADRPVHLVSAAGGIYGEGPAAGMDFLHPYLKAVFSKIGLHDLRVVRAEGLAQGPNAIEAAVAAAERTFLPAVRDSAPLAAVS